MLALKATFSFSLSFPLLSTSYFFFYCMFLFLLISFKFLFVKSTIRLFMPFTATFNASNFFPLAFSFGPLHWCILCCSSRSCYVGRTRRLPIFFLTNFFIKDCSSNSIKRLSLAFFENETTRALPYFRQCHEKQIDFILLSNICSPTSWSWLSRPLNVEMCSAADMVTSSQVNLIHYSGSLIHGLQFASYLVTTRQPVDIS